MTKPVIEQFRAAGRLANEWRDTLLYSAALLQGVTGILPVSTNKTELFAYLGLREFLRVEAWARPGNNLQLVGHERQKLPTPQLIYSSAAGMFFVLGSGAIVQMVMNKEPAGFFLFSQIIGASGFALRAGGPRSVLSAYTDVMWDYPRKNNDGGTTQTQKLKDGFTKLGRSLAGALPRPADLPGRAMVALRSAGPLAHALAG